MQAEEMALSHPRCPSKGVGDLRTTNVRILYSCKKYRFPNRSMASDFGERTFFKLVGYGSF